jgi:hypothetical protein
MNLHANHSINQAIFDAHWLTAEIILIPASTGSLDQRQYMLSNSQAQKTILQPTALPITLAKKYPHLANFPAYATQLSPEQVKQWIKYPSQVVSTQANHSKVKSVGKVQTGFLLDALYTQGKNDANEISDLGATLTSAGVQFKVWAPTAHKVSVLVFSAKKFE